MTRPRRRRRDRPDRHPLSGDSLGDLNAAELHRRLVEDAVTGYETPLPWFIAACRRIGRLDGTDEEAAYQRVRAEVAGMGGVMPGSPLS